MAGRHRAADRGSQQNQVHDSQLTRAANSQYIPRHAAVDPRDVGHVLFMTIPEEVKLNAEEKS